jgi:adenylosuccinate synthase
MPKNYRKNSIAIQGGAFGDEGKGRIIDNLCQKLSNRHKLIVYRWNGGANAGHTVQFNNHRIALHQLPSGVFHNKTQFILGKGMVIHPQDLLHEISEVKKINPALDQNLIIDEMATLALDTHRGFENALKSWEDGGKGATGRGIAPAYSDILLRHPVRIRDLFGTEWKNIFSKHYDLYYAIIKGLGFNMSLMDVASLSSGSGLTKIGSKQTFLNKISIQRNQILKYVKDVSPTLKQNWQNESVFFIFEGAQAVGLDPRFGVYPDVTASNPTFDGILNSTEGIINPLEIEIKASTLKATYTSSVGTRKLPTTMHPALAELIRRDANEFGATTKRPRDIYNLDLPALKFFYDVSGSSHLIFTHLDISYPNIPISVCTKYENEKGSELTYRPDQLFLNTVKPIYKEFSPWNGDELIKHHKLSEFPKESINYLDYLCHYLNSKIFAITFGPDRENILFNSL